MLFVQVDLEMSFVEAEGVMQLTEELVSSSLTRTAPHLDITTPPFPRMTYKEAMEKARINTLSMYCSQTSLTGGNSLNEPSILRPTAFTQDTIRWNQSLS